MKKTARTLSKKNYRKVFEENCPKFSKKKLLEPFRKKIEKTGGSWINKVKKGRHPSGQKAYNGNRSIDSVGS